MKRGSVNTKGARGLWVLLVAVLAGCGGGERTQAERADDTLSAAQAEAPPEATAETPARARPEAPAPAAKPAPEPATATPPRAAKPPTQPKPEPTPAPAAEPRTITLMAARGTELRVQLDSELSTKDTREGDVFSATVSAPVTVGDRVIVPVGAKVHGVVTAVQKPEGDNPGVLKMDFTRIDIRGEAQPLHAIVAEAETEKKRTGSTGGDVAKIGGGAVAGAILGRVIGGDEKGTLIGAAVGAAAGTAVMLATKGSYGALPEGTELRLRLEEPVTVVLRE